MSAVIIISYEVQSWPQPSWHRGCVDEALRRDHFASCVKQPKFTLIPFTRRKLVSVGIWGGGLCGDRWPTWRQYWRFPENQSHSIYEAYNIIISDQHRCLCQERGKPQVWKPAWRRARTKPASNAEGNTILIWKHLVPVDPAPRSLFSRRCAGKGWASNQTPANPQGRPVRRAHLPLDPWWMFSFTFGTSREGNGPFFILRQACHLQKGERTKGKADSEPSTPILSGQRTTIAVRVQMWATYTFQVN